MTDLKDVSSNDLMHELSLRLDIIQNHAPEKKEEWRRWKPKIGSSYYVVSETGINAWFFQSDSADGKALDCYNVFKTKEDAERCFERQKAGRAIVEYAKAVNEGWWPDWNDKDQEKWAVYYGNYLNRLMTFRSTTGQECPSEFYFKSIELAEQAKKDIGHHYKVWRGG